MRAQVDPYHLAVGRVSDLEGIQADSATPDLSKLREIECRWRAEFKTYDTVK